MTGVKESEVEDEKTFDDAARQPLVLDELHGFKVLTLPAGNPAVYIAKSWVQQSPHLTSAVKVTPRNSMIVGSHVGVPLVHPEIVAFHPSMLAMIVKF